MNHSFLLESKLSSLISQFPKHARELFKLAQSDPSQQKLKYLEWQFEQYLSKNEPIDELISVISTYHRNLQKLSRRDINDFESLGELRAYLEEELSKTSKSQQKKTAKKDVEVLYEDENFLLAHPRSTQASCFLGVGTRWCISATQTTNHFFQYSADNNFFYILINKKLSGQKLPESKFALQFNKKNNKLETIWNANDEQISKEDFNAKVGKDFATKMIGVSNEHFLKQNDTEIVKALSGRNEELRKRLMKDENLDVRYWIVRRIDPEFLPEMMKDENTGVRREVAQRIDPEFLPEMMKDESSNVRYWVAERIDPKFLPEMMKDENWYVRWEVARRMKT